MVVQIFVSICFVSFFLSLVKNHQKRVVGGKDPNQMDIQNFKYSCVDVAIFMLGRY